MEARRHVITLDSYKNTKINIRAFADVHQLVEAHDSKLWNSFIEEVESDKYGLTIGAGDYIDPLRNSTRANHELAFRGREDELLVLEDAIREKLDREVIPGYKRIAKSGFGCLGMVLGDHYIKFFTRKELGANTTEYICNKAGIPYLGEQAYVTLTIKSKDGKKVENYRIFVAHGQSASSYGADAAGMAKFCAVYPAELYIFGHTHRILPMPGARFDLSSDYTTIEEKRINMLRVGSFRKSIMQGRVEYPERAGYMPLTRGWVTAELQISDFKINNTKVSY